MLNKNKAFDIAEKAIKSLQESSHYDDFSSVELFEETEAFWTFISGSQAMFDDGIIPGAFFVSVDKTDGHIWTRRETEDFYQSKSIPELQPV
jgi:hypothetical protein